MPVIIVYTYTHYYYCPPSYFFFRFLDHMLVLSLFNLSHSLHIAQLHASHYMLRFSLSLSLSLCLARPLSLALARSLSIACSLSLSLFLSLPPPLCFFARYYILTFAHVTFTVFWFLLLYIKKSFLYVHFYFIV